MDLHTGLKWLIFGPKHHNLFRQPVTKSETPPQSIQVGNENTIQMSSIATSLIQYSQRKFEERNIPERCVIADILVWYAYKVIHWLEYVYTPRVMVAVGYSIFK